MDVWVGRVTTKKMLNEADEGLIGQERRVSTPIWHSYFARWCAMIMIIVLAEPGGIDVSMVHG